MTGMDDDRLIEELTDRLEDCGCDEVVNNLFALLDEQVPSEQASRLEQHRATCPSCTERVDAEIHIREILRRSCCGGAAPSTLRARVIAQVQVYRSATS